MAKNKVFRILSLALTLGIVISMMISCAKGGPSNGTTTDSGTNVSETDSDETETKNTPNWEYKPGNRPGKPDDTTVPTDPQEGPADDTANDIF